MIRLGAFQRWTQWSRQKLRSESTARSEVYRDIHLTSLDSNAQQDRNGLALLHFTPCAGPQSKGINLFAQDLTESEHVLSNMYVYPSLCLIGPVLCFVSQFRRPFTIVAPGGYPRAYWWPSLMAMCSEVLCLAEEGDRDTVLYLPSRNINHVHAWCGC